MAGERRCIFSPIGRGTIRMLSTSFAPSLRLAPTSMRRRSGCGIARRHTLGGQRRRFGADRCGRRYRASGLVDRRRLSLVLRRRLWAMGSGAASGRAQRAYTSLARSGAGTDAGDQRAARSRPAAATRRAFRAVLERMPWRAARHRSIPAGPRRRSELARALVWANPARHRGTGGRERYRSLAARKGRDPRVAINIDSVDEERRTTDPIEEIRHNRVSSLVKSYTAARRHDLAAVHAAHVPRRMVCVSVISRGKRSRLIRQGRANLPKFLSFDAGRARRSVGSAGAPLPPGGRLRGRRWRARPVDSYPWFPD